MNKGLENKAKQLKIKLDSEIPNSQKVIIMDSIAILQRYLPDDELAWYISKDKTDIIIDKKGEVNNGK